MVNEELIAQLTGDATKYVQMLEDATRKTVSAGEAIAKTMAETTAKSIAALEAIGASSGKYVEVVGKAAEAVAKANDQTERTSEVTARASQSTKNLENTIASTKIQTQDWAEELKKSGNRLREMGEPLNIIASRLRVFKTELITTFTLFGKQERAENSLSAAMSINKNMVNTSTKSFKEYAQSIQQTTTHSSDLVLQLAKQSAGHGLSEQQSKKAIEQSLALAEAFDKTATETLRLTTKLQQGSTEGLQEYIPGLEKITNNVDKVAFAHEQLNKLLELTKKNADTASGALTQLSNNWNTFRKSIGEIIANVAQPVLKFLADLSSEFNKLPQWVKATVATVILLGAAIGTVISVGSVAIVTLGALKVATAALGVSFTAGATAVATLGFALKGLAVVAVAYAFYELGKAIRSAFDDGHSSYKKLDDAIKQSGELTDKWAERFNRNSSKVLKGIDEIANKTDRKVKLGVEIEKANKELAGLSNAVNGAKKNIEELDTRWNRLTSNKVLDVANKELEDLQRRSREVGTHVGELQRRLEDIKPPEKELKEFNLQLRKSVETINMSQDQIKLYELSLEDISRATLDATRRTVEWKAAMERIGGISAEIKNTVENFERMRIELNPLNRELSNTQKHILQMSAAFDREFGKRKDIGIEKTTNDIETFNEQMRLLHTHLESLNKGVPSTLFKTDAEETKKSIIEYSKRVEELKTQLKEARDFQLELVRSGNKLADLMKGEEQMRVLERVNKLLDRGAELTNQYRTPMQEFKDTVKELKILSESGVINQGTFTRALDDATKKFIQLDNAARGAREEIMVFDAVEFKSTEAQRRIAEFVNESRRQLDEQRRMMEARRKALNEPIKVDPKNIEVERKAMEEARKFTEQRNKLKAGFQEIPTPNVAKADYLPVIKAFTDFIEKMEKEVLDVIPRRIDIPPMPRVPEPMPIPGRAAGGPVERMNPYVVGEKGPELFVPKQSGKIIPNMNVINNLSNKMPINKASSNIYNYTTYNYNTEYHNNSLDNTKHTTLEQITNRVSEPKPSIEMSARADATLEADTKEMVKLLKSVDSTLLTISKKEAPVIGVATIRS